MNNESPLPNAQHALPTIIVDGIYHTEALPVSPPEALPHPGGYHWCAYLGKCACRSPRQPERGKVMAVGESRERKGDRGERKPLIYVLPERSLSVARRDDSVSPSGTVGFACRFRPRTTCTSRMQYPVFRGVSSQALSQPRLTISIRPQKYRSNQLLNEA